MKAFDRGILMCSKGVTLKENPYKHGTDDYYNWAAGWHCCNDATSVHPDFDTSLVDASLALIIAGALILIASIYGVFTWLV